MQNLKFEESTQRRLANDKSICLAALFFSLNQEHGKARDLIDEISSDNINIKIASAWCYLLEVKKQEENKDGEKNEVILLFLFFKKRGTDSLNKQLPYLKVFTKSKATQTRILSRSWVELKPMR